MRSNSARADAGINSAKPARGRRNGSLFKNFPFDRPTHAADACFQQFTGRIHEFTKTLEFSRFAHKIDRSAARKDQRTDDFIPAAGEFRKLF
jgi:hypothetical protein